MTETHTKLLRHIIDCDGQLPKECYARVFLGSSVKESFFHEYDPKTNQFATTYHSDVFSIAQEHFEVYGVAPSEEALLMEVEKAKVDAFYKKDLYKLMADIRRYGAKISDTAYLIDEVREYYLKDRQTYVIQKTIKVREDSGISESMKYLTQQSALLNSTGQLNGSAPSMSGTQFADTIIEQMKKESNLVPVKANYAIKKFNDFTGGMFGGDFVLYSAGLAVGKSWALHEDALINAMLYKRKVVIWNLEMREFQVARRIITRQTKITQNRLGKGYDNLTEEEKELYIKAQEGIRELRNNVLFVNAKCQNIKQVESEMVQHFGTTEIDHFVCDYIDKVQPSNQHRQSETHDRMYRVSQEAKAFAVANNLVFETATQNNRKGNKNPDADITEMSYIQFAKDADTVIMLSEDPDHQYQAPQPGDDTPGVPGILNARFIRGRSHAKQYDGGIRLLFEPSTGTLAEASEFTRSDVGEAFKQRQGGRRRQRKMPNGGSNGVAEDSYEEQAA